MKRALINIDYTYDFVAEAGALTCGRPGQVIENVGEAIQDFGVELVGSYIDLGSL